MSSCFVHKFYRAPSEFLLEKDDPEFAEELVDDAIAKNITFSYIVVDSWYPSSDLVEFIDERKTSSSPEIKSERYLLLGIPVTKKQV